MDSCIVNAGLFLQLEQSSCDSIDGWHISSACSSFGGVASIPVMAEKTQKESVGLKWTRATINKICQSILNEILLDELVSGGQHEYR
jgi:hypothetical protein